MGNGSDSNKNYNEQTEKKGDGKTNNELPPSGTHPEPTEAIRKLLSDKRLSDKLFKGPREAQLTFRVHNGTKFLYDNLPPNLKTATRKNVEQLILDFYSGEYDVLFQDPDKAVTIKNFFNVYTIDDQDKKEGKVEVQQDCKECKDLLADIRDGLKMAVDKFNNDKDSRALTNNIYSLANRIDKFLKKGLKKQ